MNMHGVLISELLAKMAKTAIRRIERRRQVLPDPPVIGITLGCLTILAACGTDPANPVAYTRSKQAPTTIVVENSTAAGCQPWNWTADHTDCINNTITMADTGGTVSFTRGRTYHYSGRIYLVDGSTLNATGTGSRPRLVTTQPILYGIYPADNGALVNLDIRGPHYNSTGFNFAVGYYGVDGADASYWTIQGTSINGFGDTGVLGANSETVQIVNSVISHNGASGISLFGSASHSMRCGTGANISGDTIEYNGQDGIDSCASNSTYQNNVIRSNGWDNRGGDGNGVLLCADPLTVSNWGADQCSEHSE